MSVKKKKPGLYPRLATNNGICVEYSSESSPSWRPRRKSRPMHRKKLLKGKLLSFPLDAIDNRPPPFFGDAASLPPLLGSPVTDTQLISHLGKRGPALDHIWYGFDHGLISHTRDNEPDCLSGQVRTCGPVTKMPPKRTMRPMGRATTPTSFKVMFCQRVKSARTMMDLSQAEVAAALGISADTYSKYERRSLPPHFLIPRLCEVLEIEADFLFTGHRHKKLALIGNSNA